MHSIGAITVGIRLDQSSLQKLSSLKRRGPRYDCGTIEAIKRQDGTEVGFSSLLGSDNLRRMDSVNEEHKVPQLGSFGQFKN